ncbi:MAG TPA: hypothetical protein VG963_00635 [Polyangiaceae bacterium]|jgi:hypothetical protein|nr:hypothetical protein [Polyangiaceae bacterium]
MNSPALNWHLRRLGHSLWLSVQTGEPVRWLAAHAVQLPQALANRGRAAHPRHWLDPLRPRPVDCSLPAAR